MSEEPIIGPVTVVFEPHEAAELSMLYQHVLYSAPPKERLNEQQQRQLYWHGQAALKLSAALIQAMRDAGLSDEVIQRATGNMALAPTQTAAQIELADMAGEINGAPGEMDGQGPAPHPLDSPAEPHIDSPPIDFPAAPDDGSMT